MNPTRSMKKPVFGLFVLLTLCISLAFAGLSEKDRASGVQGTQGLHKTSGDDLYRPFTINNVFNYYGNNGDGSFNKFSTNNEGFEFYKGTGQTAIFEDGVVWGGYHKGYTTKDSKGNTIPQAKVGGSVYRHGLSAGPIITYGTATTDPVGDDPTNPANRVYRVRPDINPNTAFADVQAKIQSEEVAYIARYESYTAQDIYTQYINDWNQWPAAEGAPFTYGPGRHAPQPYDPTVDIPGQPGSDQTLWYVANDCNAQRVSFLAGSPVMGLEMRRTVWGYKRKGALGQTIFASTLLINKSGAEIDTMYLVQWADPDLGDGGDDFVGCDTTRSLGFVYNGKASDAVYGTNIPAAGFDFFQGPIVAGAPTDQAVFQLKIRQGFKNLPMSRFDFFSQGFAQYADPVQGAGGDIQWYRLMQGLVAATGAPFIDPTTNQPTKFCLYGDPVISQTGAAGWVDGMAGLTPQDRRMCLVTGPFTMAPGDTQELVVGLTGGLGSNYLTSINALKAIDDKAQSAYNSLFALPSPPPAPIVTAAALDGEIVLNWGDNVTLTKTEGSVSQGFTFEGYNVYEFPGPANQGGILLGTWDIAGDGVKVITDTAFDPPTGLNLIQILQQGTDNGIIHSLDLTASKVSGLRLVDGTPYYFGVTAYSYNPNPPAAAGTHSLESAPSIQTIVPHSPNPGTRYPNKVGDGIKATLTTAPGFGASDGSVTAVVVDPTKLTGDSYKVTFGTDTTTGNTIWSVTDVTKSSVLVKGLTNQTGDANYPIVDGMQVKVSGPPPGMKAGDQYSYPNDSTKWGWYIPSGVRNWTPSGSDAGNSFHLEGFSIGGGYPGAIGNAYDHWFSGSTVTYDKLTNVLLKFAATDSTWNVTATPTDANFSRGYRYMRHATDSATAANNHWSALIPNKTGGYAYQDYNYSVPFSAWNVDAVPPVRLAVGHLENNANGGYVDGKWWPPSSSYTGVDQAGTQREWFFIFATPYTDPAPDPALTQDILDNTLPIMWAGIPCRRGAAIPAAGDEFMIVTNHVNGAAHTFTWTASKTLVGDPTATKLDVTKANVFPNPYLGFNPLETNKYARFVTFTHLPTSATIRIFSLAGVLVRTIVKSDPSQFITWDLNNEKGFPVAAGMYIAYIDMQGFGTKTLKLGIIPEQQYLDRW